MAERGGVALFRDEFIQLFCDADAPVLAAGAADGDDEVCFSLVEIIGQQERQQVLDLGRKVQRLLIFEDKFRTGSSSPV